METSPPIEYDKQGRMKYNPLFHSNNGKVWDSESVDYLINWYEFIGPEEMSFALDRTIKSIMQKMLQIRNKDGSKRPKKMKYIKRIKEVNHEIPCK